MTSDFFHSDIFFPPDFSLAVFIPLSTAMRQKSECQAQAKGKCPMDFHFSLSHKKAVSRLGHWSKENEKQLSLDGYSNLLMSCYLLKVKCALDAHVLGHLFSNLLVLLEKVVGGAWLEEVASWEIGLEGY